MCKRALFLLLRQERVLVPERSGFVQFGWSQKQVASVLHVADAVADAGG